MRHVARKVGERWPLWKAGLYDLEVVPPQGHYFWIGGLAYDRLLQHLILELKIIDLVYFIFSFLFSFLFIFLF